jgi:hypothetical protein
MAKKFIPDSDSDFAFMARNFAGNIAKDPARYHVSASEAAEMVAKVTAFREAMAANYAPMTRCKATAMRKDQTRAEAERLIRDAGNRIRGDRQLSVADKIVIRVQERPTRLRKRECPQTPPILMFVGPTPGSNAIDGKHILKFLDDWRKHSHAKPEGAVRLELFVDLVPPAEPIPTWPGERWGGRMWYLRSYTRSPIKVDYPRSDELMRVVYWARWAAASGQTGPFSTTLAARVEGFDRPQMTLTGIAGAGQTRPPIIITTVRRQLPGGELPALSCQSPEDPEGSLATGNSRLATSSDKDMKLLDSDIADAA